MFIVYLKNAEAARVAETLRALCPAAAAAAATVGRRALAAALPMRVRAGATSAVATASAAADGAAVASASRAGGVRRRVAAGGATIQADIANNALIIMAPEPIYNNLRAIIEKLDVRRAQVYVEALIVEVTADKAAEFGIQWQMLQRGSTRRRRAGHRRHQLRRARQRQQHRRRVDQPRQRSGRASTSASSTARSPSPASA